MKMAEAVYVLCTLLSIICAVMLFRAYRMNPSHLLIWSAACFSLMALNNIILFVDVMILPDIDFGGVLMRNIAGAAAGSLLLFGLIWELS
jgi:hypothetical protein